MPGRTVLDFSDIITPYAAEKDNLADRKLLNNPGSVEYEETILCAGEKYRQSLINRSTFQGPDGQIAGLMHLMNSKKTPPPMT